LFSRRRRFAAFFSAKGNLPAIANPDSADDPVESTRAKTRLSRPSKAALVPARQGSWSFACSATTRWVS
jgi:hypothetical protein